MSVQTITRIVAITIVASVAALISPQGIGVASVSASPRAGRLHMTKDCSHYNFLAGGSCTISSSNLTEILVDSTVTYDQAAGIPAGLLDSNVVLDAGNGDRAIGRCTLDLSTGLGLCTFSDGTGQFTGFHARVDVDCRSGCRWDGTYSFKLERD